MSELAFTITDQDAERSKQILWMTIMQLESDYDLSQEVGNQLVYLGKRLSRRKWATIVTKLATKENLQYLAMKYLTGKVSFPNINILFYFAAIHFCELGGYQEDKK